MAAWTLAEEGSAGTTRAGAERASSPRYQWRRVGRVGELDPNVRGPLEGLGHHPGLVAHQADHGRRDPLHATTLPGPEP
jgi:hypothetical protein